MAKEGESSPSSFEEQFDDQLTLKKPDVQFKQTSSIDSKEIGLITSTTDGKAVSPSLAEKPSILSSSANEHSDITQTHTGKHNTPPTGHDKLTVQEEGVDKPDGPPVIPTPELRGKPVNTIIGLKKPCGIAVCDNGDIVVAEYDAHCITILNKEGKKVKSFDTYDTKEEGPFVTKVKSFGTKKGQFTHPFGVAISIDGHILATDEHRLLKLTTDGVCVKSVGSSSKSGSGNLQFHYPRGITVHPTTGEIFVADSGNYRIQVFTDDLIHSRTIKFDGSRNTFCRPSDLTLDNEGHLCIADTYNSCVKRLTTSGRYVKRFCSKGSAPGRLSQPSSIAVSKSLVYVTEEDNNRVSIFDTNGTFFQCFGKGGSGEGEFKDPRGITIDTSGNLYVCDTENNRLVVYQDPHKF